MERRQSSKKFMNILGVIIDETSSAKKKKVSRGLKKHSPGKRQLRHVDEGWLRRCSANSLPVTSDEEDVNLNPFAKTCSPARPSKSKASKTLFQSMPEENKNEDGVPAEPAESNPPAKKFKRTQSAELKDNYAPAQLAQPDCIDSKEQQTDSGCMMSDQFSSGLAFSLEDLQSAIIETKKESATPSSASLSPIPLSHFESRGEFDAVLDMIETEKENPKKRPLEVEPNPENENQESEHSEQPKRKFFKSRLYTPDMSKPRYRLPFRKKSPKKRAKKAKITPNSAPLVNESPTNDFDFEPATSQGVGEADGKLKSPNRRGRRPKKTITVKQSKTSSAKRKTRSTVKELTHASDRDVAHSTNKAPTPRKNTSKLTAVYDVYDEVVNQGDGRTVKRAARRSRFPGKRALTNVNDNFVRIDVEKKRYMRGKKKMTGAKVKRTDWKQRKSLAAQEAKLKTQKCRKCGETGHYAMYCLTDLIDNDSVPKVTDDSPFPTLEEAARMVWNRKEEVSFSRLPNETEKDNNESRTDELVPNEGHNSGMNISLEGELPIVAPSETFVLATSTVLSVEPILVPGDFAEEEELLKKGLDMFEFDSFRPGQREAIARVLQGLSTLLILGTGCGKSLCYQLPAYLYAKRYPGVLSLCVSPLVSLMEDQVKHIPKFLNAECLHTQMTARQKEIVLDKIKKRKLDILLISPEAICSGLFGLLRNVDDFPQIAFACIDEVHCVSEWSHNFRPSYLKLCKVLREKLNVKTILGLTATATNYTAFNVCKHLKIDPSSRIQGELLPTNLNLSVSRDVERDHALIELLHGQRFKSCDSIIIYCTRRSECERVVTLIRTVLKPVCKPDKADQVVCDAYHAGQGASHRRKVQKDFMAGKIRIVAATVAFGMGINKSNIRAIIHYNMPKTFESYVQEIGRAGRDGESAECHVFLGSSRGKDLAELKRHIYGNYIDRTTLRKLIKTIFRRCKCSRIDKLKGVTPTDEKKRKCCGHEVSFSVADTSMDLDLAEENIETLLCYMELDTQRKWMEILPKCYQYCRIQTYGGSKLLLMKAQTCPPLAAAIAMQKENKRFKEGVTHLDFNVVELASTLGWNSAVVRRELKSLEWSGIKFDDEGKPTAFRKSGILVEFSDLAHRVIVPGDLTDEDYDQLLNTLHDRCVQQERMQLYQLQKTHEAFQFVSTANILSAYESFDSGRCEKLKSMILDYFNQTSIQVPADWRPKSDAIPAETQEIIRQDILNLLSSQRETIFTGRAVAKIFQGISSPCFPSDQWNRNRSFWRKHLDLDFQALVRIASEEVLKWQ